MSEIESGFENSNDKFPNEREVLNQIESIVDSPFDFVDKFEDEQGLYMLEVYTKDEAGDTVLHTYMRAGSYTEGSSLESRIDVVYYSGDIPMGGHLVAKYQDGTWVKET